MKRERTTGTAGEGGHHEITRMEPSMTNNEHENIASTAWETTTISRRGVLKAGGALAAAATAGSLLRGPSRAGAQTTYTDSPFLADRVSSGKLPPVADRLPKEPFVVGPGVLLQQDFQTWENGQYGGDISTSSTVQSAIINIAFGATVLRSPSQTTADSKPNIVSEFTPSADFKTFGFKIRDGLKWSDGTPVTTEDVRFTFEDLYLDADVQRPYPTALYTQGDTAQAPAALKVIDDLAFELAFSAPYGFFIAALNSWITGYDFMLKPAHYLKQFHAKYADKAALDALLKSNNETSWANLLAAKDLSHWDAGLNMALGLPVLSAWVLTEANESSHIFERNPFFCHVDPAGQQLPYIDRIVVNIVGDTAATANAILAGQVTMATGNEVALNQMPIYQQNADRTGIRTFTTGSFNYPNCLFLNHDYQYDDPASVWQQLITDPDRRFVRAIAAAMDPADVSDSVYFGLYGKSLLNNTGRDPELAAQLFDAVGMSARGSDGMRLGPDGKQFILRISNDQEVPDQTPVAVLLKDQLGASGIHVEIENIAVSLFNQRKPTNEIMSSIIWNDGPSWGSGISEDYTPLSKGPWSPMTWLYFTSQGKDGRKPPAYLQEFYRLHTTRKQYPPESADGQKIFDQLMQWFKDNYVFIPTTGDKVGASVVNAKLRNVPNEGAPCELDTYINAEAMWFAKD